MIILCYSIHLLASVDFDALKWSAGPLRRSNVFYGLWLGQTSNLQSLSIPGIEVENHPA